MSASSAAAAKPAAEPIYEPFEVDVLCGRGGMSNHHPGNEWYRRLIRSNRPLYRACPKHTKLLVSKAIVQAVQQQGGRFLAHDRENGYWRVVSYKKAVDKTSQGLRERDRDGEGAGDDDDDGDMQAEQVPESFQGRSNVGPNLNDLAAVALAQANGRQYPQAQRPQQPQVLPSHQQPQASYGSALPIGKRPLDDPGSYGNALNKRARVEGMAMAATPTALGTQQSSMFRLMKQSPMVPAAGRVWSLDSPPQPPAAAPPQPPAYPTKLNNLKAAPQPPKPPLPSVPQPSMFSFSHSLFGQALFFDSTTSSEATTTSMPNSGGNNGTAAMAAPPAPPPAAPIAAPPLSRLTTQVSDWLTSFWPLQGKAEAERSGQAGYPSDPLEGDPFQDSPEPPSASTSVPLLGGQSQPQLPLYAPIPPQDLEPNPVGPALAGAVTNVPFPRSRLPPSIQQQIKIPAPFNPVLDKPVIKTVPPPARKSPGTPSKTDRTVKATVPNLPYNTTAVGPPKNADAASAEALMSAPPLPLPAAVPTFAAAPPTELEHSVSTTLLKLASTPSRLFSGFSSFFDRSSSTTATPAPAPVAATVPASEPAELAFPPPASPLVQHVVMPRRGSKSTRSLLDDDEDTPMEARLRTLPLPAAPY